MTKGGNFELSNFARRVAR